MSNLPKIFRENVPDSLILMFYECVGIKSFGDSHWFSKTNLMVNEFDALLPQLEAYYWPHKAYYATRSLSPNKYITILRQLAKVRGMKLQSKEWKDKYNNRKKTTLYRLQSETMMDVSPANFTLSFD